MRVLRDRRRGRYPAGDRSEWICPHCPASIVRQTVHRTLRRTNILVDLTFWVSATAVLVRPNSRRPKVLKLHLGSEDKHTVYEGEIVGTVLGTELLRVERSTRCLPSIALDSTAALQVSEITRPRPRHYLTDLFHDRMEAAVKVHGAMAKVVMRWVPGHMDVPGNEMADEEAKKAARGECSATVSLPARLRKSLPCSVTAAKHTHLERLRKEAASRWNGSVRGRRLQAIDSSLPGRSFLKRAASLSRRQLGVLVQLCTGHALLLKHLHRIQRSPTADCPTCGEEHESVHHFLLTCPCFASAQYQYIVPLGRRCRDLSYLLGSPDASNNLFAFVNAMGWVRGTFGEIAIKEG